MGKNAGKTIGKVAFTVAGFLGSGMKTTRSWNVYSLPSVANAVEYRVLHAQK